VLGRLVARLCRQSLRPAPPPLKSEGNMPAYPTYPITASRINAPRQGQVKVTCSNTGSELFYLRWTLPPSIHYHARRYLPAHIPRYLGPKLVPSNSRSRTVLRATFTSSLEQRYEQSTKHRAPEKYIHMLPTYVGNTHLYANPCPFGGPFHCLEHSWSSALMHSTQEFNN
jgi:hypothetical protein